MTRGTAAPPADDLHARAEAYLARADESAQGHELVHELGVRQLELEFAHRALDQRARALEAERDELWDLFDAAPVGYVILDSWGNILRINRSAARLLGVEDPRGAFASFVAAKDTVTFYLHLRRALEGSTMRCEVELRRAEGGPLAVQLDSTGLAGGLAGKRESASCCRMVITDVSSRRLAETRQRAAELLLSQMGGALDDVFYVRDARSGRTIYISPAYATVWGRAPHEVGRTPPQWPADVHPRDRARVVTGHRLLLEGIRFDAEYRIVRPDGEVRWIHDRGVHVCDGGSRFATGIARDVTQARELQTQMQQLQKLEALGRLASGVAHEYNNLLMGIEGCAVLGLTAVETCLAAEHGCPVLPQVVNISQAAERGRNLAKDLLRLHRPDASGDDASGDDASGGVASGGVASVDVVITKLDGILSRLLGDAVLVGTRLGAPGRMVPLSEGGVERLLLNLSINARDAMPDGGELCLETAELILDDERAQQLGGLRPGRYVEVKIRDTGIGMDSSTRARVFEPFFTTKDIGEGTGLGLATVRATVMACGGDVRLDSELGKGTTFTLYLPQCVEIAEPSPKPPVASKRGNKTVLVVEDEALVLMVIEHHLVAHGYEVLSALRPSNAMQQCANYKGTIDLLLTDITMPEMSGRQLADLVRAQRPQIRVLYMSAHPRSTLVAEGRIEAHMDTLEKPFGEDELIHGIQHLVDG